MIDKLHSTILRGRWAMSPLFGAFAIGLILAETCPSKPLIQKSGDDRE
jgi:Kef-type K+ transport system membrane component KefB